MKKTLHYFVSLSCLLIFLGNEIFAQDLKVDPRIAQETNVEELQRLAKEWKAKQAAEFAIARDAAIKNDWPIREVYDDGTVIQLVRLDQDGNPEYDKTDNQASSALIGTNVVNALGLNGSGIVIGEWDGGDIRATHEQYNGRVTNNDGVSISDHATHVCGTLIGDGTGDASAKGMAPLATVQGYDFNNDESEMAAAAAGGMIISNHSYGSISGWFRPNGCGSDSWFGQVGASESDNFGQYNFGARNWDIIANNAPFYLMVKSAGNDRNDTGTNPHRYNSTSCSTPTSNDFHEQDGGTDGFDCIPTDGNAKNILTVAAFNNAGTATTSFSGWGPTDDGRIKPDIGADGSGLRSSCSASNTSYCSKSGTSMSAPSVTGSCALLQEHYFNTHSSQFMRAATLKALVIHTADDIGNPGPDYSNGWGRMNTFTAKNVIDQESNFASTIREMTLANSGTSNTVVYSDGTQPLEVTIVWNDPAGTAQSGLNVATSNLVNDLDLRITGPGGTFRPWILNPASPANNATTGDNFRDNVENILIPTPGAGAYTITVTHKGTLGASQRFSMILTGQTQSCAVETVPPVITCPGGVTVNNDPTLCSATVTYSPATAVDNCPTTISYSQNSGTSFPVGTTSVLATATDQAGNIDTCSFNVTVNDAEAPVITCPANITVGTDSGRCDAVVNYAMPTATDNCALVSGGIQTVNMPPQTGSFNSGSGYPRGYWFTAPSDFVITGLQVPTDQSTAPQNVQVVLMSGTPVLFGSLPYNSFTNLFWQGQVAGNGFIPVNIPVTSGQIIGILGSRSNAGGTAYNSYVNNATVSIDGNSVGIFRLGSNISGFHAGPTPNNGIYGFTSPSSQIGRINFTYSLGSSTLIGGLASGAVFPKGTTTNTFVATDAAGNADTCSFTVTLNDTEAPTQNFCPAPFEVCEDDPIVYTTPTFDDNCDGTNLTGSHLSGPLSGSVMPPGMYTVTHFYTDLAGNTGYCAFGVTVNPKPRASDTTYYVCDGDVLAFDLQDHVNTNGNGVNSNFEWSSAAVAGVNGNSTSSQFGDLITDSLANTTIVNQTVEYTVIPTSDPQGCIGPPFKVTVIVRPSPKTQVLPANSCPGTMVDIARLVRDYSYLAHTFDFYDGDPYGGGTLIGRARASQGQAHMANRVYVAPTVTTTYWVVATTIFGCEQVLSFPVTVNNCNAIIAPVALLEGAYDATTGLQRTSLQQQSLVPATEPYTGLGYAFQGGGGETMNVPLALQSKIVDWVVLELRDPASINHIVYSRAALLLDDGRIVDTDGSSNPALTASPNGSYYVVVIHRNHLAIMTDQPVPMGSIIDFSNPLTAVHGGSANARAVVNGKALLFSGDANGDGQVQNTDDVLIWMPQAGTSGYKGADYNLDGQVQNTDRILIWNRNVGRGTAVPK